MRSLKKLGMNASELVRKSEGAVPGKFAGKDIDEKRMALHSTGTPFSHRTPNCRKRRQSHYSQAARENI